MEYKKVLAAILAGLEKQNISYAMVGAVAMGFWGVRRDTVDIDLLVKAADREKVIALMKGLGYDHLIASNFADQFGHLIKEMGLVDFLYTKKEQGIIEESKSFRGLGDIDISVALPEDIIGMKLDAIKNNPKREIQDWADIQAIVEVLGDNLDWTKIRNYCKLLDMEEVYEKIFSFR
ncbi:MAG: hypothetical protein Q8M71_00745 [Thermodesulfovibrionales bacterium]|nr:hypothetical protein [Thermodesulfovibrionales bacterium]